MSHFDIVAADIINDNKVWFTEWSEDKIGYIDKSVSIPFDIHILNREIVVEKNQTTQFDIEITGNPGVELFNNSLSFGASNSAVISGILLNATITFSPSMIDLSEMNGGTLPVTVELKNEGFPEGNHILGVSVTDGCHQNSLCRIGCELICKRFVQCLDGEVALRQLQICLDHLDRGKKLGGFVMGKVVGKCSLTCCDVGQP